jgi:hypothetical protein
MKASDSYDNSLSQLRGAVHSLVRLVRAVSPGRLVPAARRASPARPAAVALEPAAMSAAAPAVVLPVRAPVVAGARACARR